MANDEPIILELGHERRITFMLFIAMDGRVNISPAI